MAHGPHETEGDSAVKMMEGAGKLCHIHIEPATNGFTVRVVSSKPGKKSKDSPIFDDRDEKNYVYDEDDVDALGEDLKNVLTKHLGSSKK